MKKILLVCSFIMGLSAVASAQCTPGPEFAKGIYPDSATNFVKGCKDVPYEQVISIRVPSDTNVVYQGQNVNATIVSIELLNMTGLPTGYTLTCSATNCTYPGGQDGCAVINGTTSTIGTNNLMVYLKTKVTVSMIPITQNDTLDYYKIIVEDCSTNSLPLVVMNASFNVFPNPAKGNVTVSNLSAIGGKNIHIYNTEGKVVKTIFTDKDAVTFSTETLKSGIYFVKVMQKNTEETVKLVID